MGYIDIVKKDLINDEGNKKFAYTDTVGKLTIGVGHNLSDLGLSDGARDYILTEDIGNAVQDCKRLYKDFDSHDDVRKAVLVNMMFNMGYGKLSKFIRTNGSIDNRSYELAAEQMLESLWARQVGNRSKLLAEMMRTGLPRKE